MAKRTITIDLVPYDVTIENSTTVVHGCPLLRKLKKPERLCWTKSYGSTVGGVFVMIEYNEEGDVCYFATADFDAIVAWISANYDRIESIWYEALDDLK